MSEARPHPEPVGQSPLRATLELFEDALPDVRFPDVSAEVLRAEAAVLASRADAVRAAREALATAEAALAEEHARVGELAARALAYARVYAEGRPELAARLAALEVRSDAPAPRKRGRPRKRDVDDARGFEGGPPGLPFERGDDAVELAALG